MRLREVERVELSEALNDCPGAPLGNNITAAGQVGGDRKPVCGQIKAVNVKPDSAVAAGCN